MNASSRGAASRRAASPTNTVAGPVGTIVGAAIGAVADGLAGKGIAQAIDPTAEEAYWRENFSDRPYVKSNSKFDDYGPAYRHGVDSYGRSNGRSFDDAEPELKRDWERVRGNSNLTWEKAKDASRDAWKRVSDTVERAVRGDSDRDGKYPRSQRSTRPQQLKGIATEVSESDAKRAPLYWWQLTSDSRRVNSCLSTA